MYSHYYTVIQEPVTIELGSDCVPVQSGSKRRLSIQRKSFQYVPLLDGLYALLSNREILDEVSSLLHVYFIKN